MNAIHWCPWQNLYIRFNKISFLKVVFGLRDSDDSVAIMGVKVARVNSINGRRITWHQSRIGWDEESSSRDFVRLLMNSVLHITFQELKLMGPYVLS